MNRVLDASVTLGWALEDERNEPTLTVLDMLEGSEAITPHIWPLEVANGLVAVRQVARTHDLSAWDASYLEIAIRSGVSLATGDGRLGAAAEEVGLERVGAGGHPALTSPRRGLSPSPPSSR